LATARRAFYAGMNALADTLANYAPPERPISFDWPDAIRIDGVLVGGGRLGWPPLDEDQVPEWLVFSGTIRTIVMRAGEPGLRPLLGSLDEVGFEAIDSGEMLESFSRHLMAGFHDWREEGFDRVAIRWMKRLALDDASRLTLDARGDLVAGGGIRAAHTSLRDALARPSWRDPATGMPWL
jgi:hypothetical protein